MTTILYNGTNPFTGLAPTPLFSRTASMVRFGERWGQKHNIVLQGQLTGRCITYEEFIDRQQALLSGFNKDFQSLEIYDNATLVESFPLIRVGSIEFADSTYALGFVPFTVNLEAYPQEYFSGEFGVLNPREEIAFKEEEDGQISVTHTTSAQGFCTSASATNDALENARSWVAARTGWNSQILPNFIQGVNNGLCLRSVSENKDRLNANYSVTESYRGDQYGDATDGVLRYTTDYDYSIDQGVSTMSLEGSLQGCRYSNLDDLRARYQSFNAFGECLNQFRRITSRTDLNSIPLTKGVSEDVNNRLINFSYSFDDDMRPKISVAYNIDFEYNLEEDIVTASIQATVSSRGEHNSTRWQEVLAVANRLDLYSLVVPAYNSYVAQVAPHLADEQLNPNPISSSRSENQFAATVSLSASYSNSPMAPVGLDVYDASISFNPALRKYSATPILDGMGQYYIFDLGYITRGSVDISVNGIGSDSTTPEQTLAILKTQAQILQADYFRGARLIVDSQSYQTGNASFGRAASVSASFSAESQEFTL